MLDENGYLGRVHYHLAVYHHFSDAEGEPVPANVEIEGRIAALDDVDVAELNKNGQELILRLDDGRSLDFRITHEDGTIHSTGRGLHTPE